jgi:outer membrane PBP1 activator LpoA protein
MSKLYQLIVLLIIISSFVGCGGTKPIKDSSQTADSVKPIDSTQISVMNYDEKILYAEQLFSHATAKPGSNKNALLSNALLICSEILTSPESSPEQLDYTIELANKVLMLMTGNLAVEQRNQYQLTKAAINLSNYQAEKTLERLNQSFNSSLAEQWSSYYQLRAMAQFQLGQKVMAIKELIIRHGYLTSEQQIQANQNLIWNYLSSLNSYEMIREESVQPSDGEKIYNAWLELAKIIRGSNNPQTMNHAINFWLQSHPAHQADRRFINRILKARKESILSLQHIAVLLPLKGKLSQPALAIRDGILSSHYQSPVSSSLDIRFYDTSEDEHIWRIYQQAIDNGAEFIIGPLSKTHLEILSESPELTVPTLALNSLEDTINLTPANKNRNLFQFGLSPESEARIVAEKGRQDGHYYAAIMAPDNLWGQRMKTAFSEHWIKSGGVVVDSVAYNSDAHDFSDSIKSMLNIDQSEARKRKVSQTIGQKLEYTPRRRQDIDMLFMAAFPRQAKQIPLQVIYHHGETIPIYSTAHIVANYDNAKQNIDMDGVLFSDMPFLLGITQNATSEQNTYQNTLYQRLFAMGVDSYQIAPYVNYLYDNHSESFSGDTGQLTINPGGHIIRSLPWATFEQGTVKQQSSQLSQDNASLY